MKALSILIILLICIIVSNTFVSTAQTPIKPACLQLVDSTAFGLVNRDSVYIDTCQNSPTYNLIFAYRGFLRFKVKATNLPYYPDSTIIDTNWTVIDTAYPQLRSVLYTIDTAFGQLTLRKTDPADTSSLFFSQSYLFIFDSYVPCNQVDSVISAIPDSLMFWGWFREFLRFHPVIESYSGQQDNTLIIFNGNQTEINISCKILKNESVTLYDINGNIVTQSRIEEGKARLDISNLPSGVYFVVSGGRSVAFVKGGW